jgi:hypothetical protein
MSLWTSSARDALERYFAGLRPGLGGTGADPDEVEADLRASLEREVRAERLAAVAAEDVQRLLRKIGAPEPGATTLPPPPLPENGTADEPPPRRPGWLLLAFGVVLPVVTLLIELATGMCAGTFFDPLPTAGHALLVALVPVANGLVWWAGRTGRTRGSRLLGWLNGAAIGVAAVYTLLYLPLLLPGLFAMILFGWGLLPWSPLLSLICAIVLRRRLRRIAAATAPVGWPGLAGGLAAAWLALAVLDAPIWVTRMGMRMVADGDPARQQRGLAWLRALGHEETLRRECYGRTRRTAEFDLTTWLAPGLQVSAETAREIYYRVTGRPFNAVPAPRVRTARGEWAALSEWTWDTDQGGEQVGGRLRGLMLRSSRLDAVLDADAAHAYCEWTLEFRNDGPREQEARAQLLLPAAGVVSRLTLWVNGEEREAAFAGRAQVRQAYQEVAIVRRQDPVLVTTAGPDRILMQCFPVPGNGGTMKVRLGITAPLELESAAVGAFGWPRFLERNFTIPEGLKHSVWLDARGAPAVSGGGLIRDEPKPGIQTLRGTLTELELAGAPGRVRVERDPARTTAWVLDERGSTNAVIRQELRPVTDTAPRTVAVVVDGSGTATAELASVVAALSEMPEKIAWTLIVARDAAEVLLGPGESSDPVRRTAAQDRLRRSGVRGGTDHLPALVTAWDFAATEPGGVVLWIHAPQPVLLSSVEPLRQRYERRPHGPRLLAVPMHYGPNRVLEQLDGVSAVSLAPRTGTLREDLAGLLRAWGEERPRLALVGERVDPERAAWDARDRTSFHLARLWAAEEIGRLRADRQLEAARALAATYQLVTPVSGAVVLETQAQYDRHDLVSVDPKTVPAIPEPGTWALLAFGLAVVGLAARAARRRRVRV